MRFTQIQTLADLPPRILCVGDEKRLVRWFKRLTGNSRLPFNPTPESESDLTFLFHALNWLFLHPASTDFLAQVRGAKALSGLHTAVRMNTPYQYSGPDDPEDLELPQLNQIRDLLDATEQPLLLFGPYDTGLGQMILSRLPFKRYTGMKARVDGHLRGIAKSVGISRIPPIATKVAAGVKDHPNDLKGVQQNRIRALSFLGDLLDEYKTPPTKGKVPSFRIDPFVPTYAWDLDKQYLQAAHAKLPSLLGRKRQIQEAHLRKLAKDRGLDLNLLNDAVFKPAFDIAAFLGIYDPERRYLAKFVQNALGRFDIRKSSQKLSDQWIVSSLERTAFGVGFYSQPFRKEFTLLLLVSVGEAWRDSFVPTDRLSALFAKVIAAFGRPSVCFRDVSGLTATWPLANNVPDHKRLAAALEQRITALALADGDRIQVKPQAADASTSALLIPDASAYVDNVHLLPAVFKPPQSTGIDPVALFGKDILLAPAAPIPKVVHQLDNEDRTLIDRIVSACPGSPEDRNRVRTFLEQLIPHLRDLEDHPEHNHCRREGGNVFAIPSALLADWGYRYEPMKEWLGQERILEAGRAYTSGEECLNPKARCYKFNWHASPPPDPRPLILYTRSASDAALLCGIGVSALKKYRNDPESMPLRRYLLLQSAIAGGVPS